MTNQIAASWFLVSEKGEPLGQVHRGVGEAVPSVGDRLANGAKWKRAEVISFSELRQSCGVRRFRVVVRVLE